MAIEFNAKLIKKINVTPNLAVFQVKPDEGEIPAYKAGQYVLLGLPGNSARAEGSLPEKTPAKNPDKFIVRSYSIASTPKERNYIEFNITMVLDGLFTPRLFNLKEGDPIHLGKKITGLFTMEDATPEKNILLCGTGTGLAPLISMLRTHLSENPNRKIALFHGVRTSHELSYREELEGYVKQYPNFSYFPTISRPQNDDTGWSGPTGYVQKLWEEGVLAKTWGVRPSKDNTHVFLCGSPGMIQTMQALLEKESFQEHSRKQAGQITIEKFW